MNTYFVKNVKICIQNISDSLKDSLDLLDKNELTIIISPDVISVSRVQFTNIFVVSKQFDMSFVTKLIEAMISDIFLKNYDATQNKLLNVGKYTLMDIGLLNTLRNEKKSYVEKLSKLDNQVIVL